jgi:hypothetical protein
MIPSRVVLMAALGLIMSATAQAQQTEGEREAAALDEVNRVTAMMKDINESGEYLEHANPREIMEYCQQTLPKLDDAFRVLMTYATSEEQRSEVQRSYLVTRQNLLNLLVQAQLALGTGP